MKKHILLILKTLISNNACVEASRTRQIKYNVIAIVFAILGVFLAVLPTTVTSFKKSGSDWMNTSYIYNCDQYLYNFCDNAKNKNTTLTIVEDEKKSRHLEIRNWEKASYTNKQEKIKEKGPFDVEHMDNLLQYAYIYTAKIGDETNVRAFEVYNFTEFDDKTFTTYVSDILNNLDPFNGSKTESDRWLQWTLKEDGTRNAKVGRSVSTIFFGKNTVYAYLYKYGSTSVIGSMGGDYQNSKPGELISRYFTAEAHNKPEVLWNNWKSFFNEAYLNNRWNNSWRSTGIMVGVDAGVLLFMGLMVFILTRGKNNPFRIYTFWDAQKIAYYSSFTPSLLALAFGFLLTNMAMMFYVLALGIRVMWLSMRTLRYNAPAK